MGDRSGNDDVFEILQLLAERYEIVGLLPKIELAQQAFAQLIEHLAELITLAGVSVGIEKFGDIFQRIEIVHHRFANLGPLHFDGHGTPVSKLCAMNLTE